MRTHTLLALFSGLTLMACSEDGKDGADGTDGASGSDGANGSDGTNGEDGEDGADASEVDGDGDGVFLIDDCDDADAAVGAATTFYIDYDGDGFGSASVENMLCEPMTGWVDNADDCDDLDADTSPDATEVCDGWDNNCDGTVDDADPLVDTATGYAFYVDADEDGYGDDSAAITYMCEWATGYAEIQGDCDDADDAISPDAEEICDDGIDQDCDGGPGICSFGAEVDLATEGDFAVVPSDSGSGDYLGYNDVVMTDFNGDGYDDLVAGAYGWDGSSGGEGATYIWYGSASASTALATESAKVTGSSSSGYLGQRVVDAGDVNNDGLNDLLIGEYGTDSAYLIYGNATALSGTTDITSLAALAGATISNSGSNYYFGYEMSGVGDNDGDGYDDVLVTNYYSSSSSGYGTSYLLLGSVSGLSGSVDAATEGQATFEAAEYGDYFGYRSATTGGDFDGDGYADIAIGEYSNDDDGSSYGRAFLFMGPSTGATDADSADTTFTASSGSGDSYLGRQVQAIGDWNDDGLEDLAIGAYWYDGGAYDAGGVFVWYGSSTFATGEQDIATADVTILGSNSSDYLSTVNALGDVSGDGVDDLWVAASGYDSGSTYSTGGAAMFLGQSGSAGGVFDFETDADSLFTGDGSDSYSYFGYGGASGDIDGDGSAEVFGSCYSCGTGGVLYGLEAGGF